MFRAGARAASRRLTSAAIDVVTGLTGHRARCVALAVCLLAPWAAGAGTPVGLAVGDSHACAVTSAGTVTCWGSNTYGQLGDGTTTNRLEPVPVSGLTGGIVAVSTGWRHSCALTRDGGLKCWGYNSAGQLGDNTTTDQWTPVDVSGLGSGSGVVAVSTGRVHTCALTDAGAVQCWGRNLEGQLGNGTTTNSVAPVNVTGLASGVQAILAAGWHTCAVTGSGGLKCWGYNSAGQLGDGTHENRLAPVDVSALTSGVLAVAGGLQSTCALRTTGGLVCWGGNSEGQLGNGTTAERTTPGPVTGLTSGVATLSAGNYHACAVLSGGGLKCWGDNLSGQLGDGTTLDRSTPVEVPTLGTGVATVAGGGAHTCALAWDGAAACWGENGSGQLGDGTTTDRVNPGSVPDLPATSGLVAPGARGIAAGSNHSCLLTTTGGVLCVGANGYGQLGDGTGTSRRVPVPVHGLESGVTAVAAGESHSCALTAAGGVKCWGRNDQGQLGDATTTNRLLPVDVSGLMGGVAAISAGQAHTCAVTTAGALMCWGDNQSGQLGDGSLTDRLVPTQVVGLATGVAGVSAGYLHTCARTAAGGLKCWGWNAYGQLGDGTGGDSTTPVWVSGLTAGTVSVAAGYEYSCAVTAAGGLRCWGHNNEGLLGMGPSSSTPVDYWGVTGMSAVSTGLRHVCGLKADGRMVCWGSNSNGLFLGDPSVYPFASSLVVPRGLGGGVAAIAVGELHTCAVTDRGGAFCWGYNQFGQLGDGTKTDRGTPQSMVGMANGAGTLAAGGSHACRVTPAGGVQCWGDNQSGQLGDGTFASRLAAVDVHGLTAGAVAVAAGAFHSCALTTAGGVKCWGTNGLGQLGDGTTEMRSTPVDVSGLTSGVVALSAGGHFTCARTAAGGVKCWGFNSSGQVGDATTANRAVPVWVTGLTSGVRSITAGNTHACAVTATGALKCWGRNVSGQLGDGTTTSRATMGRVTGLTSGVLEAAAGGAHTCALTTNTFGIGVKCWGLNAGGRVGDGTILTRVEPVDVSGLTTGAIAIRAGDGHSCALTGVGLMCWGENGERQLGDGTTTDQTTPVAVLGLPSVGGSVGEVEVGYAATLTVTAAGGTLAWGLNSSGQLGDGTTVSRGDPVAVRGFKLEDDFDGDGKADVAVYRPSSGTWFSLSSSTGNASYQALGWGLSALGDTAVPGCDVDGDGLVDPTVFRPGVGTWFTLLSSASFTTWDFVGWGAAGDTPVPADYDGDGRTDRAVYRPSTGTWYIRPSGSGVQWSVTFGNATDVPFPGHFDGDGRVDIAVYRPSTGTWFVLTSASGYTSYWYKGWGIQAEGDTPAPGDYDGDGKLDLCVFRASTGTWFVLESHANFTTWAWFGWGGTGDVVVPSDFDGDGVTDAAVYRPSTGEWYVRPSLAPAQWSVVFGQAGDVPLITIR